MEGRWPGLEEWQGTRGMGLGLPWTQAMGVGTTPGGPCHQTHLHAGLSAVHGRLMCMLGSVQYMSGLSAVHGGLVCSAVHGRLVCSAGLSGGCSVPGDFEEPKCVSRGYSESGRDSVVLASFLAAPGESRCCKWQWLPCHMT